MKTLPLLIFICVTTFITIINSQIPITGLNVGTALAAGLAGVAAAVAGGAGLAALAAALTPTGTTQAAPQNNYGGYPHSRQASLYRGYQSNQGYPANQGYPSGQESSYPSAQGADYQETAKGEGTSKPAGPLGYPVGTDVSYDYAGDNTGFYRSYRYKRDTGKMSIEDLAEMDDYDCGKQYLCELSAMQAGQHNIQDPLLISLLQNKTPLAVNLKGFRDAAMFGKYIKDTHQCNQRYKLCASGNNTMVSLVQFLAGMQEDNSHLNDVYSN